MTRRNVSLKEMREKRPVNETRVKKQRDSILTQSRALRLSEIRKSLELTQTDIAELLGVDQSNISRIERGLFRNTEIGTLRAYIEALGGTLEIHARVGNRAHKLIDGEVVK
jgi:transcriptional regulator with XRE-family HTH domain